MRIPQSMNTVDIYVKKKYRFTTRKFWLSDVSYRVLNDAINCTMHEFLSPFAFLFFGRV